MYPRGGSTYKCGDIPWILTLVSSDATHHNFLRPRWRTDITIWHQRQRRDDVLISSPRRLPEKKIASLPKRQENIEDGRESNRESNDISLNNSHHPAALTTATSRGRILSWAQPISSAHTQLIGVLLLCWLDNKLQTIANTHATYMRNTNMQHKYECTIIGRR